MRGSADLAPRPGADAVAPAALGSVALAPAERVEAAELHRRCANCGARLQGPYCHACGQKAHLHTRVRHLAEDFVEGVMHFDGRLWRTLPLLAFRPGRLSREWIEGRRVRYVAPLHVFLFGVFLFFLTLSLSGGELFTGGFSDIAENRENMIIQGRPCVAGEGAGFRARLCDTLLHIDDNPKYYAYKAETSTYKLAPLMAPISMAILALLLVFKRGYTLYDHGVVALYGLGFLALLTTASIVLSTAAPGDWALVVVLAASAHALVHLRGAYRLSWFGAGLRTLALGVITTFVFALFLLGVVAVAAA